MKTLNIKSLLYVAFALLMSCNDSSSIEGAVKSLYGKRIKIDWDNEISITRTEGGLYETPYKIVAPFDEDSCTSCFLGHLDVCIDYCGKLPSDSVTYICIVPIDAEQIISTIKAEGIDLKGLHIISDVNDTYARDNRIDKYSSFFCTYLLDANDRIIIVGDPIRKSSIRKLYNKKINKAADE